MNVFEPEAILALASVNGQLEMQIGTPKEGGLDLKNPAHSVMWFLGEHWNQIIDLHNDWARKRADSAVSDVEPKEATSVLAGIVDTTLPA